MTAKDGTLSGSDSLSPSPDMGHGKTTKKPQSKPPKGKDSGKKNLSNIEKYMQTLSVEEARQNSRKGGINSGKSRNKRKTFRESLNDILCGKVPDTEIASKLLEMGLDPNVLNGINFAVVLKALQGDVEAARYTRDSSGEKPTEALQMTLDKANLDKLRGQDLSKLSDSDLQALQDAADSTD